MSALPRRPAARWRLLGALLAALLTALYLAYAETAGPTHGGSVPGLAYGFLAALLVLVLLFFGVRKRWYRSRWGTLEGWLQAHLYLGIVALVAALFHAGFRFHDRLAVAALVTLVLVVATGIVGAILYGTVPRLLTEVQSNLSGEDTSRELNRLTRAMARLARGRSPAFEGIHRAILAQSLPRRAAGLRVLFTAPGRGAEVAAQGAWTGRLREVPAGEEEALRELLVLSRQHKELHRRLAYQERYQNLLTAWLYLHVPLSVALLVLVAAHVLAAVYYGAL